MGTRVSTDSVLRDNLQYYGNLKSGYSILYSITVSKLSWGLTLSFVNYLRIRQVLVWWKEADSDHEQTKRNSTIRRRFLQCAKHRDGHSGLQLSYSSYSHPRRVTGRFTEVSRSPIQHYIFWFQLQVKSYTSHFVHAKIQTNS